MSLVEFAKFELDRLVKEDDDGMQQSINAYILNIVEVFASQGHSGSSAGYSIGILTRLLSYQPLGPLTGAPDEWTMLEHNDDMWAQNKRCSHVFLRRDGTAYDIEAVVFRETDADGHVSTFTGSGSTRDIKFPYTPVREYQDVAAPGDEFPIVGEVKVTGGDKSEEPLPFNE